VERLRVVEETLVAGASVARVALKHGVNANQVFQWRRLYRDGKLGVPSAGTMKLLPVSVADDEAPLRSEPTEVVSSSSGAIHIELPGEVRISLEGCVDPAVVRVVLMSLRP
jgi:transposase